MSRSAILLSIKPRFVRLIESGVKHYEFRRVCPKVTSGDLALVYASSPVKCLVGAFTIGEFVKSTPEDLWARFGAYSGLGESSFAEYFRDARIGCAIGIDCYFSLDEKVSLNELRRRVRFEPPQSYRYVGSREVARLI